MTVARASKPLQGHGFTLTEKHEAIKIEPEILQQGFKLQIWPVMKGTVMNSNYSNRTDLQKASMLSSAVYLPDDVTQVTQSPTHTLTCSKYMKVDSDP